MIYLPNENFEYSYPLNVSYPKYDLKGILVLFDIHAQPLLSALKSLEKQSLTSYYFAPIEYMKLQIKYFGQYQILASITCAQKPPSNATCQSQLQQTTNFATFLLTFRKNKV